MLTSSYVISDKTTGKAIFETFQKSVADKVNTNKYMVETAHEYLVRINLDEYMAYVDSMADSCQYFTTQAI